MGRKGGTRTIEVTAAWIPQGLPPKARQRLDSLGPGRVVDRPRLVQVCGSAGAADQFYAALLPKGYLVPAAWGHYAVPRPETLRKLAILPPGPVGQAVSWAETLPWSLEGAPEFGLLALASWTDPLVNIPTPAPVFALGPRQETLQGRAPSLEAFFADLLEPVATVRLTDQDGREVARLPGLGAMDEARLFLLHADDRFQQAGQRLAASLSPEDRAGVDDAVARGSFPQPAPRGKRTMRLPTGPPHHYRLYAPPWFLDLHHQALEAKVRRERLGRP